VPKGRRAVRLVFNTYYKEDADKIINALRDKGLRFSVTNSRVVPELYYVDIDIGDNDLSAVERVVKEIYSAVIDGIIYI